MTALVRAELLKLRSTRTSVFLVLGTLAMVVLTVVVSVPRVGEENAALRLDDPDLLALVVGSGFGAPQVLMVLLGGMAFTQEFRYGTATSTYLVEPRRSRVLAAKWVALALASLVVSVGTLAVGIPVGIALIASRDGVATTGTQFWQMVVAACVVMAGDSAIGVALGVLIRNQIVAAVAVLVWMLAVEQIVLTSFTSVGRWMPWGASEAVMQLGPEMGLEGKLLPVLPAGLLLLGYTAAVGLLAVLVTPRRDVL
jgi:ABC-type transport system involved in multi-copper enzyme maturation permease subunit